MPGEPQALALLALMLLNDARRDARLRHGDLVALDDQDRELWDWQQIADGRALLERAMAHRGEGPYVIQAAIADLHMRQPRDWEQIAALYGTLAVKTGSPVVEMNRAIAVAELDVPPPGSRSWTGSRWSPTATSTPPARTCSVAPAGTADARRAYARAIELAQTDAERRYLQRRLTHLVETSPGMPQAPSAEGSP